LPFLPLAQRAAVTSRKAMKAMGSPKVSDHWKEKAMMAYAGTMMGCSMKLAGLIVALFAVVGLIAYGADMVLGGYIAFLTGLVGLAASLVFATAWAFVRGRVPGIA
ncbi:MAG: hypothetical protein AAFZ09_01810, partial [Pseudomonadota bacterium]